MEKFDQNLLFLKQNQSGGSEGSRGPGGAFNVGYIESFDRTKCVADKRLEQTGFIYSPSQPNTPKDGNCLVHAILDQMR